MFTSIFGQASVNSAASNFFGGTLTLHSPETLPANWQGYFTRKEDAQHDQMLKALKGQKTHIYELRIPL